MIIKTSSKEYKTQFLIPEVKLTLAKLGKAFSTTSILRYFDLKCHSRIKIVVLSYTIDGIVS